MSTGSTTTSAPGASRRLSGWLPSTVDRRVRVFAWLSFVAETLIIATGGAVRLTGSGLGCPTWPTCTPESLVPTADMGIHGVIEFGNRLMTGVVGIIALVVLILVWRMRRERRDLFTLAVVVVLGVAAQAIVGGITVLTGLNPFIVGFHYTASLLLVCVTAAFLERVYAAAGARARVVPLPFAIALHATGLVLALTIIAGVLTTGAGPHSGDADVIRDGIDAGVLAHWHSWPGYVLLALVALLTAIAALRRLRPARWLAALLVLLVVQIVVGVWQARDGLPELLVGIHMVLAALTAAAYTVSVLRLKAPAGA